MHVYINNCIYVILLIYLKWVNIFIISNFNYCTLLNILLLNILNLWHPIFTYCCWTFIFFLYTVQLINYFYISIIIYYYNYWFHNWLKYIYILITINIGLSMWWAFQEGTWDGWWSWDISEIIIIFLFYSVLWVLHFYYYKNIYYCWLFYISNNFLFIWIYYKLIKLVFLLNLHLFFNFILLSLWFFNNIYYIQFIIIFFYTWNIIKFNRYWWFKWYVDAGFILFYYFIILFYFFKIYIFIFIFSFLLLNFWFIYLNYLNMIMLFYGNILFYHMIYIYIYIYIYINYFQFFINIRHYFYFYFFFKNIYTMWIFFFDLYIYVLFIWFYLFNYIFIIYWNYNITFIFLLFNINNFFKLYLYFYIILINVYFYENLYFIFYFINLICVKLNFIFYYNWLRFSLLTPSYFIKNRLLVERGMHNRLVYSFFGFTYKSFTWTTVVSSVIGDYSWKNIYYCLIILICWIGIYVLFNFNFLVFNFPIRYWYTYIIWRIFDGFYFFFLQFQYLILISIISSSWYILNTYFNIQLNLLYLIIFNYFNINIDIQVNYNNTKILNKSVLNLLFNHYLIFDKNLFIINYYFYSIKFYLNFNLHCLQSNNNKNILYWNNFLYSFTDNILLQTSNLCKSFYLFNIIKYNWFLSLNINNFFNQSYLNLNFSNFIHNWFVVLKLLRWDIINLDTNTVDLLNFKSIIQNFYITSTELNIVNSQYWLLSLEWITYRWMYLFKTIRVVNRELISTYDYNFKKNIWILWNNNMMLLNWIYFNKYELMSYRDIKILFNQKLNYTYRDIFLFQYSTNLFLYETLIWNYYLLFNNLFTYYSQTNICFFSIIDCFDSELSYNKIWIYYL
jgi:hypothetical protein